MQSSVLGITDYLPIFVFFFNSFMASFHIFDSRNENPFQDCKYSIFDIIETALGLGYFNLPAQTT